LRQVRVESRPRNDDRVARVRPTGTSGQQHTTTARAGDDHVTHPWSVSNVQVQIVEQSNTTWPDQVTARLVATDACLVDECDAGTALGEGERGDAARRTGPDDDCVVTCSRH
jgi:hypothetical protein